MHMTKLNAFMRSKAKIVLAVVCVVVMFVWFVPLDSLIARNRFAGGRIYGEMVSGDQVEILFNTIRLAMSGMRSEISSDQAYAQVWETLILNEEAQKYGVRASESDVNRYLSMRFPNPGQSGIDEAYYLNTLHRYGLTRQAFEKSLRMIQTGELLRRTILQSTTLPPNEAWLWYSRDNEQIQADYIALAASDLAPLIQADSEAIKAFYEKYAETSAKENKDGIGYLEPKRVKLDYIVAPYASYSDQAVVTEREIEAHYAQNKERYAYGPQESEKGVRPLEDVKPMIIEDLQRSETERLAGEAIREVDQEIAKLTATEWGSDEALDVNMKEMADKFGLPFRQTELFAAAEAGFVVPGAYELAQDAFNKTTSIEDRRTISCTEGKALYRVTEVQEPNPAPLDQVSARVEKDYRTQQALTLASEIAGHAAADSKTIEEALAKVEAQIAEQIKKAGDKEDINQDPKSYFTSNKTEFFARPMQFEGTRYQFETGLPPQGNHGDAAHAIFGLKEGEVGAVTERGASNTAYLVARVESKPADMDKFQAGRDMIAMQYLPRKQQAALSTWLGEVQRRAAPSEDVVALLMKSQTWTGAIQ